MRPHYLDVNFHFFKFRFSFENSTNADIDELPDVIRQLSLVPQTLIKMMSPPLTLFTGSRVQESYEQHRQSRDRQRRTDAYKGARCEVARHTMTEQQLKTPMKEPRQEDGTRVKESYEQLRHTKELGLVEESYAQHRQSHDRQRRTDTYKGARCESRPSYYARATAQNPHEGAKARRWDTRKRVIRTAKTYQGVGTR
jgi:hypothetical protein